MYLRFPAAKKNCGPWPFTAIDGVSDNSSVRIKTLSTDRYSKQFKESEFES